MITAFLKWSQSNGCKEEIWARMNTRSALIGLCTWPHQPACGSKPNPRPEGSRRGSHWEETELERNVMGAVVYMTLYLVL